jgi:hypothetical protein
MLPGYSLCTSRARWRPCRGSSDAARFAAGSARIDCRGRNSYEPTHRRGRAIKRLRSSILTKNVRRADKQNITSSKRGCDMHRFFATLVVIVTVILCWLVARRYTQPPNKQARYTCSSHNNDGRWEAGYVLSNNEFLGGEGTIPYREWLRGYTG